MESSWRDDPYPTPGSSNSSHFHKRGLSEVESSLLWTTSQSNGELGLVPPEEALPSLLSSYPTTLHDVGRNGGSGTRGKGKGVRVGPIPIAVWAKVMDSSKGRDKVLVSPPPLPPALPAPGLTYVPLFALRNRCIICRGRF